MGRAIISFLISCRRDQTSILLPIPYSPASWTNVCLLTSTHFHIAPQVNCSSLGNKKPLVNSINYFLIFIVLVLLVKIKMRIWFYIKSHLKNENLILHQEPLGAVLQLYTAVSRKVVGKSARNNPERYCGWFLIHCFSKKFQRMAWETMDVCLRVLKESNKSRFDSYSVRNKSLIISHITFRDCRMHSFCDNLSRNSCICTSASS